MKYRQLRVIATGQWVNVLFTVAGDGGSSNVFSTSELSHRTDIALALGLAPTALEVVDADTDIRVGVLLPIPPLPPIPLTSEQVEFAEADLIKKMLMRDRKLGLVQ